MRSQTEKSILRSVASLQAPPGTGKLTPLWFPVFPSTPYVIVGIAKSAPSFTPDGQREVTVLVRV